MQEFSTWTEVFLDSLRSTGEQLMGAIPAVVGAIFIFLVGWLCAKLMSGIVHRLLKLIRFDELADRVNAAQYLQRANIQMSASRIVAKFIYWIVILLVLITASDTLGWNTLSEQISRMIAFLPNLLLAVVIFILGTYIASFVRSLLSTAIGSLGISTGKIVSSFVFYLLFIVVSLTAMNQAGIDTSIISNNLLLILGAVMAAAAISYGIASKDILANILAGHFGKNIYPPGAIIEFEGNQGKVVQASSVNLTIQQDDGDLVVIPFHKLMSQNVRIITTVTSNE